MLKLKNAPGLNHKLMLMGLMLTIDEHDVATTADDKVAQTVIDAWTLADSAAYVCADVGAYAKALRDQIVSTRSAGEMASWPIKAAEAAKYAATGDEMQVPLLRAEAAARGISVAALVAQVGKNATMFLTLEATISGTDGKHRDALKACASFDEISAYNWSTGWPQV